MHRLFVAIRPPEDTRDLLIDAMDDSPELRWVTEHNLHLTLRFIGEVERPVAEDIAAELGRIRAISFRISAKEVGIFDQRNGGALWAGVQPKEEVAALASKIERACQSAGLAAERRTFRPHITLARFGRQSKPLAATFIERNSGLSSQPFAVDHFTLFQSRLSRHGALYEEVASYALG